MSPATVSGREAPRRRGDVAPLSATSTVFPTDLSKAEAAEENWEKGSGRDQENTPSSQPVLLEAPSDLDLKHPKERPTRPPVSSLSRSEADSWVGVPADEPDLSARTVTPPLRESSPATSVDAVAQDQITPGSNKESRGTDRTPESRKGDSPTSGSGSGSVRKVGRSEQSSKAREEIKRSQIPSHWMTKESPPLREEARPIPKLDQSTGENEKEGHVESTEGQEPTGHSQNTAYS